MDRFALPWVCGLALATIGACGGAQPDDFSPVGGGSSGPRPGGSSGGSGGSSSGSSGGASSNGGSSSGQGSSSASGSGGTSSSGDDGGGQGADASLDAPDDGADDAAAPGLACRDATHTTRCDAMQICCITTGLTGTTAACQNGNGCTGTAVHCAVTADCPMNQVCCATGTTTGFTTTYTDVSCVMDCPAATGAFMARYQLCDPNGTDCPAGKTCMTSTGLSGYSVCR